jgi:ribosome-associated heat shock protein Hsp15
MSLAGVRLDKWLWVARFFKTRSLAAQDIAQGRVQVNGQTAKASREVRVGDRVDIRQGPLVRTLTVKALSLQRGSATVAQTLFEETAESVAKREQALIARKESPEPAHSLEQGRPTKRDRRQLMQWQCQEGDPGEA